MQDNAADSTPYDTGFLETNAFNNGTAASGTAASEPQYTIEARSLNIAGGMFGHDFWVLRDENGQAMAELHGLATERATNTPVPIGTDAEKYSLRAWQFAHDAQYAQDHGVQPTQATYMQDNQPSQTIVRAGKEEVMARWNAAVGAIEPLNAKDLDYPSYGFNIVHDTINSNSAYRTFGEIMGLPVKDFPGRSEPGIDHRMASPQEIEQWRDPRYPVLTEPTIRPDPAQQGALSPQDPSPSRNAASQSTLSGYLDRMLNAAQTGDNTTFHSMTQTLANQPAGQEMQAQAVAAVNQQEQWSAQQAMQQQPTPQNPTQEAPSMQLSR